MAVTCGGCMMIVYAVHKHFVQTFAIGNYTNKCTTQWYKPSIFNFLMLFQV